MTNYADAGVNNDLKQQASKMLYAAARNTWANRKGRFGEVISPASSFSGLRGIDVGSLPPGTLCSMGFDGVGTKMELGERLGKHDTVAFDLFAMVCDDAVMQGAEPVLVGSILDVKSLKGKEGYFMPQLEQLAKGYEAAAKAARVAVINGEIAELGARVQGFGDFNYNWGAGVLWFAQGNRAITGNGIQEGQSIIALREKGFRSNGLSLVRKIFRDEFGDSYQVQKEYVEQALAPSTIYCAAICDMFGGAFEKPRAKITGVAHITGGGIPEKLGRVLPAGCGAMLYDLFEPSKLMQFCQESGKVSDEDAYRTWNMGQGMLVITPEPTNVLAIAAEHCLEAKVAGIIGTSDKKIHIQSKGVQEHMLKF